MAEPENHYQHKGGGWNITQQCPTLINEAIKMGKM